MRKTNHEGKENEQVTSAVRSIVFLISVAQLNEV
jgi:hypothetical protein